MAKTRKHGVWKMVYIVPNMGKYRVTSQRKPIHKGMRGASVNNRKDLLDEKTERIIQTSYDEWAGLSNAYLESMSVEELQKTKKYLQKHIRRIGMTDRYIENIYGYQYTLAYLDKLIKSKGECDGE